MLKLQSLTKEFGELTAVDSINLKAPTGQMPGVIGRSGAGSTTMRWNVDPDSEDDLQRKRWFTKNKNKNKKEI